MASRYRFRSGSLKLAAHLAGPVQRGVARSPGLVICHGFPAAAGVAATTAEPYAELADRIASELGWTVLVPALRGISDSEGQFSLGGWLADTRSALAHVAGLQGVTGVWAVGFGTGAALVVCAAAAEPSVRGVAALAAPADFDDWASQPRRLLEHSRDIGLVTETAFPQSFETWAADLRKIRAVECAVAVAPRPLLVVHGTEDESVPPFDARVLADAHGAAELRMITGASHLLRHDPRAMAILLGWLDRERDAVAASVP